jgi:type II secretory pathway pseudopilin PulG
MRKKFELRGGANSFTLLEMLGVLAVMAILASVAVPPMIRSLQNAQSVNEDKNLEEIGRALCEAIKAEGQVPDPGALATATISGSKGWVAMAAPYCSMASDAIQYVFPGRTETERRFYILTLTGITQTPSLIYPGAGNYQVPSVGWDTAGNWPDIMASFLVLISSSKPDYLLACPANGSATYTTWANLPGSPGAVKWAAKEWVKQAVDGVYSATETQIVGSSWTDKGQFLHVKVIPMNSLICKITFSAAPAPATFIINGGGRVSSLISGSPLGCFTTRGSSVTVDDTTASPTATASATGTSSLLDFRYNRGTVSWEF